MKRSPCLLSLGLAGLFCLVGTVNAGALTECRDYRGKGQIRVRLQPDLPAKQGEAPNELLCRIEQVFVRPDQVLLSTDWLGLRQQMLAKGSVEQVYQPTMGVVIERKYLNLKKSDENPILALQTSMVECGRLLREARSTHSVGKEQMLAYDCDIVEADSREILQKMGDLVSPSKNSALLGGKVKAWVVSQYGVPAKLEIYTASGNLAAALTLEELQFNTGVKPDDLKLNTPTGTRKVSIEVDVTAKDWQQKMEQDLRQAVTALTGSPRS